MNKDLIVFALYWLPEAYLLILTALILLGIKINLYRVLLSGLCLAIITFISRQFLFNLGLHTPVILISLIIILSIGFKLRVSTAITGCFLSFFLLLMGESFLMGPSMNIFKITFKEAINNPWLHIAFGWVSEGFLIIAILICKIGKVTLIKAPESIENDGEL